MEHADRIDEQKHARKILVTLYEHSTEMPDRGDTLQDGPAAEKGGSGIDPRWLLRAAIKGVRGVAQTTTNVFGNVASEIAGRYGVCARAEYVMTNHHAARCSNQTHPRQWWRRLWRLQINLDYSPAGSSTALGDQIPPWSI
jgi:hypothetical protein